MSREEIIVYLQGGKFIEAREIIFADYCYVVAL